MNARWLAVFLSTAGSAIAADPASELRQPWMKRLDIPSAPGEQIVAAVLDSEVYGNCADAFADLRLGCEDGQVVPYALERVTRNVTRTVRDAIAGQVATLREAGSNRLEIVWDRTAGEAGGVNGFHFAVGLRDFERRVSVFAEADGAWTPVVTNALLFDYSRFMDVRQLDLRVPRSAARRFRFVIDEITDRAESPFTEISRQFGPDDKPGGRRETLTLERRPLHIASLSAWSDREEDVVEQDAIMDYGALPFTVAEDGEHKQTVITAVARREPLVELRLETSSRNFSRAAEVQVAVVEGVRTTWRSVASGTLSSVQFGAFSERRLALAFPARRESQYRIVIHNRDNPPLAIAGVYTRGQVYRLVFLHDPSRACRLSYGAAGLSVPSYDTATVLTSIRRGSRIIEAKLGPAEAVAGAPSGGVPWRRWLNSRLFFGVAVTLAVLAIGAMLYRAVKHAAPPQDPA